jgi:hypothetical protein
MRMRESKILKAILLLLGTLLIVLGMWRVLDPVGFYANSGIILSSEVSMLNEARAAGGVVVGFALLIVSGVFFDALAFTSTVVSAVLFLSYAGGRLFGIAMDGNPGAPLVQGLAFELVFGAVAVAAFLRYRVRSELRGS